MDNISPDVLERMVKFQYITVSDPVIPEIELARAPCGAIITATFENGRKRVTLGENGSGDIVLGRRALGELIARLQDIHSVMLDDAKPKTDKEKSNGK